MDKVLEALMVESLRNNLVQACDNEKITLHCPRNTHILIQNSFYGRLVPSQELCPGPTTTTTMSLPTTTPSAGDSNNSTSAVHLEMPSSSTIQQQSRRRPPDSFPYEDTSCDFAEAHNLEGRVQRVRLLMVVISLLFLPLYAINQAVGQIVSKWCQLENNALSRVSKTCRKSVNLQLTSDGPSNKQRINKQQLQHRGQKRQRKYDLTSKNWIDRQSAYKWILPVDHFKSFSMKETSFSTDWSSQNQENRMIESRCTNLAELNRCQSLAKSSLFLNPQQAGHPFFSQTCSFSATNDSIKRSPFLCWDFELETKVCHEDRANQENHRTMQKQEEMPNSGQSVFLWDRDPCPSTSKYLQISYKCKPISFEDQNFCQGTTMQLACKPNKRLSIYSAQYGHTVNGQAMHCSSSGQQQVIESLPQDCVRDVLPEILKACHAQTDCSIGINDHVLGTLAVKTSKSILVSYTCV
uniref:SUEL-type lectin domain-containing protein n=1 Tax=Ditylenchus dipsaci TaxID=166011 RepID=A0A915DJQ5_9BILA